VGLLIIIAVVCIVVIVLILNKKLRKNSFPWYQFYSRGKKEGFSFKEIGLLRKAAVLNKLEKPQSIYWSTKQLDRCLRAVIQSINKNEHMSDEDKLKVVDKLLELRKKAEFNLPKYNKRIRDTRPIMRRQKLIIRDKEYGTFISWVVENNNRYLVITQPAGHKGWESLSWKPREIGVYFNRKDDAGYFFRTKVVKHITKEEYPLLYVNHNRELKRYQKRRDIRINTNIRSLFQPISYNSIQGDSIAQTRVKKYSGRIIDISGGGCCMIAGSKLKKNDRLKIDFFLSDNKNAALIGTILGTTKTDYENVKKYHILFLKIDLQTRHNILFFVYNIFGERDDQKNAIQDKRKRIAVKPERAIPHEVTG
jgi:c-di-GMP-binding flagellar brake protein YcgR